MTDTVASMVAQFGKDYKDTDIARIGIQDTPVPRLPTGLFPLDLAIGGGFPEGRCSVIYGPEQSMKTTICLLLIASAQKKHPDKRAVFIDIEGHFDADWAKKQGVNVDELAYIIPTSAEQFVDMCESLLYAEDVSIIVADSLAALVTTHELDSDADKAMVGNTGIIINKFYRKVSRALSRAKSKGLFPTLICINQIRYKIGVMYGSPETMPGGPSFKFASSLTIRVSGKDEMDKDVSTQIPAFKKINCTVHKQKIGITNKNAEVQVAILPIPKYGLKVGECYAWNTIVHYLKDLGLLSKGEKGGWDLTYTDTGEVENFPKQDSIRERMTQDHDFDTRIRAQIFDAVLKPSEMIYK